MGSKQRQQITFDQFYHDMYGDRWTALRASLQEPSEPRAYVESLVQPYYLDDGSVLVARQLPLDAAYRILDMCAAPGGKSLVLASVMHERCTLTCNDRSSSRRARLHRVLDAHLMPQTRSRVSITSHDATRWGMYEQQAYDAILLDAPCSSERHVIQDPKAMASWTASRTKHLAIQQFAMLAAALEAVVIGGYILYSTCSISVHENEEIIAKLHRKRSGRFEEISLDVPQMQACAHGHILLPDTAGGAGPLYCALIRRTV